MLITSLKGKVEMVVIAETPRTSFESLLPQAVILYHPEHFGPCAGVDRAIDGLDYVIDVVEKSGVNVEIWCVHEIVHHRNVVKHFTGRGVKFTNDITEIPNNSAVYLSAHGHEPYKTSALQSKGCYVIDGTCQLVSLVHNAAVRHALKEGKVVIYIGKKGHQEMKGVEARVPKDQFYLITSEDDARSFDPTPLLSKDKVWLAQTTPLITQTQRIVSILKERIPDLEDPNKETWCYATQENQDGAQSLIEQGITLAIVIGEPGDDTFPASSNSLELTRSFQEKGVEAHLVLNPTDIDPSWLLDHTRIGLTAGASAPREDLERFSQWLANIYGKRLTPVKLGDGKGTQYHFKAPGQLEGLKAWLKSRKELNLQ